MTPLPRAARAGGTGDKPDSPRSTTSIPNKGTTMQITFNTENEDDLKALKSLADYLCGESEPAAKPAPAPTKKSAAPKPAAKPAPEPEPEEEDLVGGDEPQYTREDMMAKATELVSNGKAATVKAALVAVGSKKVGEVPDEQIDAFMAELG